MFTFCKTLAHYISGNRKYGGFVPSWMPSKKDIPVKKEESTKSHDMKDIDKMVAKLRKLMSKYTVSPHCQQAE